MRRSRAHEVFRYRALLDLHSTVSNMNRTVFGAREEVHKQRLIVGTSAHSRHALTCALWHVLRDVHCSGPKLTSHLSVRTIVSFSDLHHGQSTFTCAPCHMLQDVHYYGSTLAYGTAQHARRRCYGIGYKNELSLGQLYDAPSRSL